MNTKQTSKNILGKSPCDGIGGTVKHLVARASLQNTHILSVREMFERCITNIEGISFFLVSSEEVEEITQTCELEKQYVVFFNKFQGSKTHHSFIPKENKLLMKTISKDYHVLEVLMPSSVPQFSSLVLKPGMYVACVYEGEWFIGGYYRSF